MTHLRRGLDLLEQLPQIDTARIGFEGNNCGGAIGAILAGLDRRVKVFALAYVGGYVSTLGSWDTRPGGEHSFAAEGEAPPTGASMKRYEAQMSVVDPAHYIGHNKGGIFLLMNAPHEWPAVWRDELNALIVATPKPKTVVWVNRNEPATGRTMDGPREPQAKAMLRWLEQNL